LASSVRSGAATSTARKTSRRIVRSPSAPASSSRKHKRVDNDRPAYSKHRTRNHSSTSRTPMGSGAGSGEHAMIQRPKPIDQTACRPSDNGRNCRAESGANRAHSYLIICRVTNRVTLTAMRCGHLGLAHGIAPLMLVRDTGAATGHAPGPRKYPSMDCDPCTAGWLAGQSIRGGRLWSDWSHRCWNRWLDLSCQ
jgi:hypothetical protein